MWRNLPTGRQVGRHSRLKTRNMYFVYALKSLERNYVYVGLTDNIERRFGEHQSGNNKTTKAYSPFRIIYVEEHETRPEARQREIFLKSGVGKEFLKTLKK